MSVVTAAFCSGNGPRDGIFEGGFYMAGALDGAKGNEWERGQGGKRNDFADYLSIIVITF